MTTLLDLPPYAERDDRQFLAEMEELTRLHHQGCPEFARMWPQVRHASSVADLPYVHVGLFKRVTLKTAGAAHERVLRSSGTTGASSAVALDAESSALQARSSIAILSDFVGTERVPLLIVDHASSLRQRDVSARIAAAMSLRPLASDIRFLLKRPSDLASTDWASVEEVASRSKHIRVYGFTTALWQGWAASLRDDTRARLADTRIDFVHSGGWKKLEVERVTREVFDDALLRGIGRGSRVIDYYGLVEQVGVIFPLCSEGHRHVPRWADVVVRDPWTFAPVEAGQGLLQFLNVLAHGAPYHSVVTEDLGALVPGACACGRAGKRFDLHGRVPEAELRGCANV